MVGMTVLEDLTKQIYCVKVSFCFDIVCVFRIFSLSLSLSLSLICSFSSLPIL